MSAMGYDTDCKEKVLIAAIKGYIKILRDTKMGKTLRNRTGRCKMMKQRFIDGKDPDFGLISQLYYMSHAACDMIHVQFIFVETSLNSDYVNFDKSIIYDHEDDKAKTENWFDEDSDEESQNQDVQNSLNHRNDEDEDSEDDYKKMDLSKL